MEIKNVVTTGLMPGCGFDFVEFSHEWKYYAVRNDGDTTMGIESSATGYTTPETAAITALWLKPGETGIVETNRDVAVIYSEEGSEASELKCTIVGQDDKVIPWVSNGSSGSGGGVVPLPFDHQIAYALGQAQTANPAPVTATLTKQFPIIFGAGLISDNVLIGDVLLKASGDFAGGAKSISSAPNLFASAGFAQGLSSSSVASELTGYFPYSDGGAFFDLLGLVGMNRLPSSFSTKCVVAKSGNQATITFDEIYDHTIIFVAGIHGQSGGTITVNDQLVTFEESAAYGNYAKYGVIDTSFASSTLTIEWTVINEISIVAFGYNE